MNSRFYPAKNVNKMIKKRKEKETKEIRPSPINDRQLSRGRHFRKGTEQCPKSDNEIEQQPIQMNFIAAIFIEKQRKSEAEYSDEQARYGGWVHHFL